MSGLKGARQVTPLPSQQVLDTRKQIWSQVDEAHNTRFIIDEEWIKDKALAMKRSEVDNPFPVH